MKTQRTIWAFSLLEVLVTVVIVGILSGMAIVGHQRTTQDVQAAKLESDVRALNRAVSVYLANGGSLTGMTAPQAIVDKMKSTLTAAADDGYVGFGGSLVDPRLAVRPLADPDSGRKRVVWDGEGQRFEIRESGAGVVEFFFSEAMGAVDYGQESRAGLVVTYNAKGGWIWPYKDSLPQPRPEPFSVALLHETAEEVEGVDHWANRS